MKAREMFALAIRILGLMGLAHVIHSVAEDIYFDRAVLPGSYYVIKAVYVLVGFYCLCGAPQLVALAYGCEKESPPATPPAS